MRVSGRRAGVWTLLALLLVGAWRSPETADAQEVVPLYAGCNNVSLTDPVGAGLAAVASAVQPAGSLIGIFRYDAAAGRFLGFAPDAPAFANDYLQVGGRPEAVFICVSGVATLSRSLLGAPAMPAVVARGLISAPRSVRRPATVEVLVGTGRGLLCVGGVNVSPGRFIPILAQASGTGVAAISFELLETDRPGFADFSIRCADDQYIKFSIEVL